MYCACDIWLPQYVIMFTFFCFCEPLGLDREYLIRNSSLRGNDPWRWNWILDLMHQALREHCFRWHRLGGEYYHREFWRTWRRAKVNSQFCFWYCTIGMRSLVVNDVCFVTVLWRFPVKLKSFWRRSWLLCMYFQIDANHNTNDRNYIPPNLPQRHAIQINDLFTFSTPLYSICGLCAPFSV